MNKYTTYLRCKACDCVLTSGDLNSYEDTDGMCSKCDKVVTDIKNDIDYNLTKKENDFDVIQLVDDDTFIYGDLAEWEAEIDGYIAEADDE